MGMEWYGTIRVTIMTELWLAEQFRSMEEMKKNA
jgi:hypothetical protein